MSKRKKKCTSIKAACLESVHKISASKNVAGTKPNTTLCLSHASEKKIGTVGYKQETISRNVMHKKHRFYHKIYVLCK